MAALSPAGIGRLRRSAPAAGLSLRRLTLEQAGMVTAQLGAGVGNMAFALVTARLLAPAAFAHLSAFCALYLLVNVPATSLTAAAALDPAWGRRVVGPLTVLGLVAGLGLALSAHVLSPVLGLSPGLIAALGACVPGAAPLATARGWRYQDRRFGRGGASLLAEPAVRLGVGILLTGWLGPLGGAVAVVAGGYVALAVANSAMPVRPRPLAVTAGVRTARVPGTLGAFLVLAVIQNQDLVLANRLLPGPEAGRFAALSVLGGIAAFASITVPLVLLSHVGQRRALPVAVGSAALIGAAAVAATAVAPGSLLTAMFGSTYRGVAGMAAPYVGAMALLGVTRVLAADRCAGSRARSTVAVLVAAAAVQAGLIVTVGHSAAAVGVSTLVASVLAAAGLVAITLRNQPSLAAAGGGVLDRPVTPARPAAVTETADVAEPPVVAQPPVEDPDPTRRPRRAHAGRPARSPEAIRWISALTAAGLLLRLGAGRSLWIDEAVSVQQARMGFHAMLTNLRTTDVHPPLYFSILWATIRVLGRSEMAVRFPSIVAGALLIPAVYLAASEIYDRRTGVVAGCLAAVAPFAVWYSQEARMYTMFMLWAVLAVWAQVRAVRHNRPRDWVVFGVVGAALVWTQYFGVLQLLVQWAAGLAVTVQRRRAGERWRAAGLGMAMATAVLASLLLPLVPFAHHQFVVNQRAGKGFKEGPAAQVGTAVSAPGSGLSIYVALANVIWGLWGYHSDPTMAAIVALWPVVMLLAFAALGRRQRPATTLLLAACVVPSLALLGLGLLKRDLFEVRYVACAVPLALILVARGVPATVSGRTAVRVATLAVVATMIVALVDQQTNGANPRRFEFRGALAEVRREMGPGDRLLYAPSYLSSVVHYYAAGLESAPLADAGAPPRPGRVFLLSSDRLETNPVDRARLTAAVDDFSRRRMLVSQFDRPNVHVWVFQ